jgi:hypothetical protein
VQGEADAEAGDVEAWRAYARLAAQRSGERMGPKSSYYWVMQALEWLTEHGMARPDRRGDGDRWVLTERFRLHVADLAGNAAFDALAERAADAGTAARTFAPAAEPKEPKAPGPGSPAEGGGPA